MGDGRGTMTATSRVPPAKWRPGFRSKFPFVNDEGFKGYFWQQPEPEVSADGSRILYNGNCDQTPD